MLRIGVHRELLVLARRGNFYGQGALPNRLLSCASSTRPKMLETPTVAHHF